MQSRGEKKTVSAAHLDRDKCDDIVIELRYFGKMPRACPSPANDAMPRL
jgi:hypothetical protein